MRTQELLFLTSFTYSILEKFFKSCIFTIKGQVLKSYSREGGSNDNYKISVPVFHLIECFDLVM